MSQNPMPLVEVTRTEGELLLFGAHLFQYASIPKGADPEKAQTFVKLSTFNHSIKVMEPITVVAARYNTALAMGGVMKIQQPQPPKSDILVPTAVPRNNIQR